MTSEKQERNLVDEAHEGEALHTPPERPDAPNVDTPHFIPVVRAAPMQVKARQFSGETSWQEFHSHFERVCILNGWFQQRLDYLWVNLTSTALAYAESLPVGSADTYDDLCRALEQRFGDSQRSEVYKSELRSRQRKDGESLPALSQEIRQLVKHAYPTVGRRGMEDLCIEKFREALTDGEQRMAVHRSHARTLEEATKAAMDMESWQLSERRTKTHRVRSATSDTDPLTQINERIAQLEKMIAALGTTKNSTDTGRKAIVCFYCKNVGHIRRDCRIRARDLAKEESNKEGNESQLH
jgi:hypothetical protein